MKTIHKLVYAGFASVALLSASVPALAWTTWPDVDFEWYANVGKPLNDRAEAYSGIRAGYIWAPGHWESRGTGQSWVAGHYVKDDYDAQIATFGSTTEFAEGVPVIRDSMGNEIPTSPSAYGVDSALR